MLWPLQRGAHRAAQLTCCEILRQVDERVRVWDSHFTFGGQCRMPRQLPKNNNSTKIFHGKHQMSIVSEQENRCMQTCTHFISFYLAASYTLSFPILHSH